MSDCAPKGLPKGPWRLRKYALDQNLLLRFISGETVIVQHVQLPQDAEIVRCQTNGTDTELFVQSQTFDLKHCLCNVPTMRVNYSTGG